MNKENLLKEISNIPKFRLRSAAVKKDSDELLIPSVEWAEQEKHFAITEVGKFDALTFVGDGYRLIQFESIYRPIVENIPELDGELLYDNGYGYLFVFPVGDRYKNKNDEFGLSITNSVNCTASVMIKFIVKHEGKKILLPDKLASFKRKHEGSNVLSTTKNYLEMIDQIKDTWKRIMTTFSSEILTPDYVNGMKLGKKCSNELIDKLLNQGEVKSNLWDAFMYAFNYYNSKDYKTEVHRRKRLDKLSETIIEYGVMLGI